MEHCEHYAFDITLIAVFFLQLDAKPPYNLTVISVLWGEIDVPSSLPFKNPLTSPGGLLSLQLLGRLGVFPQLQISLLKLPFLFQKL